MQPITTQPMQKTLFVKDLAPEIGRITADLFLLKAKNLRPFADAAQKGLWLELTLADKSGVITGKVWEGGEELAPTLEVGGVVKLAGDVKDYRGKLEIKVHKVRMAAPPSEVIDMADYLPATDKDFAVLWERIDLALDRLRAEAPDLHTVINFFYGDDGFRARLAAAPSTVKVHHNYLGGVLEQIAETLTIAETFIGLWPALDGHLLRAGALLALVGKTRAFSPMLENSDEGEMLGCVIISSAMLEQAILQTGLDPEGETALRLRHMVVAQNGRPEWGSPRRPQTLEAEALAMALESAAQMNRFALMLKNRAPGAMWTEKDGLLGRALYGGNDAAAAAPVITE